ncbi:MAG: hypothetical protein ABSH20_10830 [Tepidisphaeraceae bacterium]|jgi:hypothetical protein
MPKFVQDQLNLTDAQKATRLYCAAVDCAQTSLDPKELREWMPNYSYGAHAFGLTSFQSLIDNREKVLKRIKAYSPIELVSPHDPPIGSFYLLGRKGCEGRRTAESVMLTSPISLRPLQSHCLHS